MKVKKYILNPLEKYCGTDVNCVNKFLVSIYVELHSLKNLNKFLKRFIITENCKHFENYKKFKEDILKNIRPKDFGIEELIEAFEFVISPKEKVVTGAVYTPKYIREYIVKETLKKFSKEELKNLKIVDFSCGCGGFLIDAALYIKKKTGKKLKNIFEENVFGIDIADYSIERTEILFNILLIKDGEIEEINPKLYKGNSLNPDFIEQIKRKNEIKDFDVVLGNPPYVCARNIPEESKKLLKHWKVCSTGLPDLYIPFFQIGLENISNKGILGYITMNTFFKSLNATALRKYFMEKKFFLRILDFGSEQVFKSKSTYTCLVFIDKGINSHIEYAAIHPLDLNKKKIRFSKIYYDDLSYEKGWNLKNVYFANKIENTGKPLGQIFKITSGIATLRDKIYIIKPIKEDDKYFYLETGDKIEKEVCKNVINSNKLTRKINPKDIIYPIIFPYRFTEENKPVLISEDEFIELFPHAYNYLSKFKEELLKRDKGKAKNYPAWYAYGRTQNLEKNKYKMFFPHLVKEKPFFHISDDEDLYGVNGMMAVAKSLEELILLKNIMSSNIFWEYIKSTSKNYSTGYYSLGLRYLKFFGIPDFSEEDKETLREETIDTQTINEILKNYYS